jgi:hypothetical protein
MGFANETFHHAACDKPGAQLCKSSKSIVRAIRFRLDVALTERVLCVRVEKSSQPLGHGCTERALVRLPFIRRWRHEPHLCRDLGSTFSEQRHHGSELIQLLRGALPEAGRPAYAQSLPVSALPVLFVTAYGPAYCSS